MRYKLAIFDFDGTLADSFAWFCGAVALAATRYRFRVAREDEVDLLRGLDAQGIARHLAIPAWKMPLIARFLRQHMAQEAHGIRLFPGIDQALRELRQAGVTLAIVTSNARPNVERVLGPELSPLISHFGCGAALFGKRPKIRAVLRRAGLRPHESIYVGDEIRDLHAARSEGLHFGAVSWGYTHLHGLSAHGPDAIFTSAEQMSAVLTGTFDSGSADRRDAPSAPRDPARTRTGLPE